MPAQATALALIAGLTVAIIDLCLSPSRQLNTALDVIVIAAAVLFLVYRIVWRGRWKVQPTSWAVAAAVSLLMMAFAFQSFMPEFAEHRSINANAARLQKHSRHDDRPVVYFAWDTDAATFYLAPEEFRRFEKNELQDATAFLAQNPEVVVVADRSHIKLLRAALGNRVELTAARGGRGRLYVATSQSPLVTGARPRRTALR